MRSGAFGEQTSPLPLPSSYRKVSIVSLQTADPTLSPRHVVGHERGIFLFHTHVRFENDHSSGTCRVRQTSRIT